MELSELILTIDTREQNKKRIGAVETWFNKHGGIVEHSKLDYCDYHIEGEFRECPVNIGIEAKGLPDFIQSYSELPNKLAHAYKLFNDVGLFVEAGDYVFRPEENDFNSCIIYTVYVEGIRKEIKLPLAVYENMLASLQSAGVHVRQLRSEYHFPYAIANLLIHVTKPEHTGLYMVEKDYVSQYLNVLMKIPGIGGAKSIKLKECYPNLHWLCSSSSESLQEVLGKLTGKKLDAFIHCHELETEEWRNTKYQNGTEKHIEQYTCSACGDHTHACSCMPKIHSHQTPDDRQDTLKKITPCSPSPGVSSHSVNSTSSATESPSLITGDQAGLTSLPDTNEKFEYKEVKPNKNGFRMSLKERLKVWFEQPHTMKETVDQHKDWQAGRVFDMVMGGIKKGYLVKFDDGTIIKSRKWEEMKASGAL